jgi:hypothetical protein
MKTRLILLSFLKMQKTLHRMFIGVKSCSTIEARGENKDPLSILPFNAKTLDYRFDNQAFMDFLFSLFTS